MFGPQLISIKPARLEYQKLDGKIAVHRTVRACETRERQILSTRIRIVSIVALLALLAGAIYWQSIAALFRAPPPPEKLSIAVIDTYLGSGLVLLAGAKGYYADEGLEVTLQAHGAGDTALGAVLAHKADMTTIGNMPLMFATLDKTPLAIVATIARAYKGAAILARRDRGVASASDLKGKTVGVTPRTDGQFVLSVILADHGMAWQAVRTEDIRPGAMIAALTEGKVDAISTWEPILSGAKKALGANGVTFDLASGFSFWFHLAGRQDYVRSHPESMKKLLRALLRAQRFVEEHPAEAFSAISAATRINPEVFKQAWPNFRLRLALPQAMLTTLEDQASWAIANHYTDATAPPNFLNTLYLDGMLAVRPDMVTIVR